jgi:outer membrane receptor protein involved in Fe transport
VYYIDWNDLQIQLRSPLGFTYQANGSRAKSEGVELSLTYKSLAGTTVSGWVAYNDAVLTEDFVNSPSFGESGDRLPNGSRWSGHVSLEQQFALGDRVTAFVGGRYTYVGDRVGQFTATAERQEFPSYATGDLRAGLEFDSWSANFFINNVTDKRGLLGGGIGYIPPFAVVYNQPRTYGINVSKTF